MDFHSLTRRDLQFLCKRNKIPANMTNLAMADALKALEIVEGLNEYMSQYDSNAPHSPTSVAKQPPNTATRTTRRKTAMKVEPQSSSQLVNCSSHLTSKSLAGEMEQETKTNNVKFDASVAKTPAARSTRKASAAVTSCSSKVQESKKVEMVQSVYSTRRSTRLLEKCMADLSLKGKDNKPEKDEETEQKESEHEKNSAGLEERSEEDEVIPGRDLSASMEKEWDILKNDSNEVGGDVAVLDANIETNKEKMNDVIVDENEERSEEDEVIPGRDLSASMEKECDILKNDCDEVVGDLAILDANIETNKEKMDEVIVDENESGNSLIQADKQEETLQDMCEEGSKKNDNDQEIGDLEINVDLGDIPVLEEYAKTETNNDTKESNNVQIQIQVDQPEIEAIMEENGSEADKINSFDTMVDQTDDGDSETEPEEDTAGFDAISEADSNQAVLGSDIADEEMLLSESEGSAAAAAAAAAAPSIVEEDKVKAMILSESEGSVAAVAPTSLLEEDKVKAVILSESEGSVVAPVPAPTSLLEEDKFKAMILSESEGSVAATAPISLLEETKVKATTPLSPFAAGTISVQFPRPNKSTTTPSKKSDLKMVNVDNKENNMEMMMMMDNEENKGEAKKEKQKKKKVEIDEENLKDVSIRQLVKMVKELSIKSSNNRTALQILPGNNI